MRDVLSFRNIALTLLAGWLGLFALLPNVLVLVTSFLRRDERDVVALEWTLESYRLLLDPVYVQVFIHSTLLAVVATVSCLLIGYPFAYILARQAPNSRRVLLLLIMVPFWTNSLVRSYAMRTLLAVKGVINEVLLWLGLIDKPLRMLYNDGAVVVGLVYVLLPFMVLPLYAVMEKLDGRLLEAAIDLGASRLQTFRRVVLPLTLPGIVAGALLVFLPGLSMFYVADLLGGAKSMLVGNFIKNQFLSARNWPFGSAASAIFMGLMGLLLFAQWSSRRWLGQEGNEL